MFYVAMLRTAITPFVKSAQKLRAMAPTGEMQSASVCAQTPRTPDTARPWARRGGLGTHRSLSVCVCVVDGFMEWSFIVCSSCHPIRDLQV